MSDWINELATLHASGEAFALVSVIRVRGSAPRERGARMMVTTDRVVGTIGGGGLEHQAIEQARTQLHSGEDLELSAELTPAHDQICGGAVDLLIEIFNSGPRLILFGAGHVARALTQVMQGTGVRIECVDAREDQLQHPEMPASVIRHLEHGPDYAGSARFLPARSIVCVMTHSHELDLDLLRTLLPQAPAWLGLMGSKTKWHNFRRSLLAEGFSEPQVDGIHCPLGSRKLGKLPREIAISIATDLLERIHAGE